MQETIGINGEEDKTCEYVDQSLEDYELPVKCTHSFTFLPKGKHKCQQYQGKFFFSAERKHWNHLALHWWGLVCTAGHKCSRKMNSAGKDARQGQQDFWAQEGFSVQKGIKRIFYIQPYKTMAHGGGEIRLFPTHV